MPQASKGLRQALTVRLPIDLYREVARRAATRDWSVSQWITWCVARELLGSKGPKKARVGNTNRPPELTLVAPAEALEE